MSITLIQGPMFSGKTTELIRYAVRADLAKKKTIMIKFSEDTRYSTNKVVSHDHATYDNVYITNDLTNVHHLSDIYNVILIDEGQFFKGLGSAVRHWAKSGVNVYISALTSDFYGEPWEEIKNIGPIEYIVNLSAICMKCGEDAYFTELKDMPVGSSNVLIGADDKYIAVCRKCFINKLKN